MRNAFFVYSGIVIGLVFFSPPAIPNESACNSSSGTADVVALRSDYHENKLQFVGLNHQDLNESWLFPQKLTKLREINPTVLRYPGGTVSTYWDHRNDRLFPDKSITANGWVNADFVDSFVADMIRNGDPDHVNALENFSLAYMEGGFNPVFALNLVTPGADYYQEAWGRQLDPNPGSSNPDDDWWLMLADRADRALDMLERAEALGLPIRFVELGNEYYFVKDYMSQLIRKNGQGDGSNYAYAANYFASRIKERFPNAKIAAITTDARTEDGTIRIEWNQDVLPVLDRSVIDAVSLHIYIDTDNETIAGYEDMRRMLTSWKTQWESRRQISKLNLLEEQDWDVWITEMAANFYTPAYQNTWANALLNSYSLHYLNTVTGYEMAALQQFVLTYEKETSVTSNLGIVATVWSNVTRNTSERADLVFSSRQSDSLPGEARLIAKMRMKFPSESVKKKYLDKSKNPLIFGGVYKTADGSEKYIITNIQNQPLRLDVSLLGLSGKHCQAYFSDTLTDETNLVIEEPLSSDTIIVPKLSIVMITP